MIYIFPLAGLANRMRVIASALSLSRELNQKIIVIWKRDKGLNADYKQLFKSHPNIFVVKYNLFFKLFCYVGNNPGIQYLRNISHFIFNINIFITEKHIPDLVWKNNDILDIKNLKIKSILFVTYHQFYHLNDSISELLPVDPILDRAKNILSSSTKVIGLHIRRNDLEESKIHSPLYLFEEKIDFEIINDPEVKFYLSSDDIDTIKYLNIKYKDYVIYFDKKFDRSNSNNIIDAYVDLCALSMCSKIYGSYFSSFSYVSSKTNNVNLTILYV